MKRNLLALLVSFVSLVTSGCGGAFVSRFHGRPAPIEVHITNNTLYEGNVTWGDDSEKNLLTGQTIIIVETPPIEVTFVAYDSQNRVVGTAGEIFQGNGIWIINSHDIQTIGGSGGVSNCVPFFSSNCFP